MILTNEGKECVFPFTYNGAEYHRCTTAERTMSWCATNVVDGTMIDWGYCHHDQGKALYPLHCFPKIKLSQKLYLPLVLRTAHLEQHRSS